MVGIGCKLRLSRRVDWCRRSAEQAHGFGTEIPIAGTGDVDDVHEQIEVTALAAQREVFDKAQIS